MPADKSLKIYLNDHLAGSVAGLELARRCLSNNREGALGEFLLTLVSDIESDQSELIHVMDLLRVPKDYSKQAAAWVAEKVGRLKLNGQLLGYSPLSRVIELEALVMGVHGKECLWESLIAVRAELPELESIDLERLRDRARSQWLAVEAWRRSAAEAVFLADVDTS